MAEFEIRRLSTTDGCKALGCYSETIYELIAREAELGNMLFHSLSDIQDKVLNGHVVGAFIEEVLVGSCLLYVWSDTIIEVGGLVVDQEFRRKRIGLGLIRAVTAVAQDINSRAFIFCLTDPQERKGRALGVFEEANYTCLPLKYLAERAMLDSGVDLWRDCKNSPCPCQKEGKFVGCKLQPMVYGRT